MNRLLCGILLQLVLVFGAASQTKQTAGAVDVELTVRGPNGNAVPHADVLLQIYDRGYVDPKTPDINAKTDGRGIAFFKAPEGVYRLLVKVHGVGYANIGTTEFVSGHISRPQMPPLVAYGSIDGTFPVDACSHDVTIHASSSYPSEQVTLSPDSPGQFHIEDAFSGYWTVQVSAGKERCAEIVSAFELESGQKLKVDVPKVNTSNAQPVSATTAKPLTPTVKEESKEPVVWVRGTVRDDSGQPVSGASVMGLATFQGSIRMYQLTSKTLSDSEGRYELKGKGDLLTFSVTVLASAPGHPPAWAWLTQPQTSAVDLHASERTEALTQDLVLPTKSGKLTVTVVHQGQPLQGISVALYLENANLRDVWAYPLTDSTAIMDAAYPVAKTNSKGIASFDNLLPGRYRILATADAGTIRNSVLGVDALRATTSENTGIPVRVGNTTNFTMNIYEQRNSAAFRVLRPDGPPFTGTAAIAFGPASTIGWSSSVAFDGSGSAKWDLDGPGWWQMRVMYRDSAIATFPIREPYFLAEGYVATSANLDSTTVSSFIAHHVEPGSARIRVEDVEGKPLHVDLLLLDGSSGTWDFSGTTNDHGKVVFRGLTSGQKYYVRVSSTPQTKVQMIDLGKFLVHQVGQPSVAYADPTAGSWDVPLPPPEEMRAEPAIMEQMFIARANTETRLVMRAVPLTYIYGVLRHPTDAEGGHWGVWVDYPWQRRGVRWRSAHATGEYIIGPFPTGDVRLNFGTNAERVVYHATVHVDAKGKGPTRFDIDVEKYPREVIPSPNPATPDLQVMGMGGIAARAGGAQQLTGRVFLADGVTPALGAQVFYFQAHRSSPSLFAMSDAVGSLQPRGLWYTAQNAASTSAPGSESPIVVAFLPGECGAIVQALPTHLDAPLRLVLPPPITVAGRVSVGRASPANRPGVIRVVAAFQSGGFLNPYLTVNTTADADGNFTLAGVSPGDYLIQAALDNIWLSSPVTLHVTGDFSEPINLDIPSPGAGVQLKLRDLSGKPVVGGTITLEHSGPMASLWPTEWVSDGAGSIYVPTLETGWQTVRSPGSSKPVRFMVPLMGSTPVVVPVTTEQPGTAALKIVDGSALYEP